ncbi:MAG: hypothetical protein JXB43_02965 [Dehalococcoidia bacterium]|nr:hypothetical protein [Dehalococcoidia bacterium]
MPLGISLAHKLMMKQAYLRKNGYLKWLRSHAKAQVTVHYVDSKPVTEQPRAQDSNAFTDGGSSCAYAILYFSSDSEKVYDEKMDSNKHDVGEYRWIVNYSSLC